MSDGRIVIDVQVNGNKLSALASDLKKLESDANRSSNGFKSASQMLQNAGNQASKAGEGFKKAGDDAGKGGEKAKQGATGFEKLKDSIKNFSVGAIAFKAVNAGLDLITASLDKAIDRFDTLQRFPKVMQSLGHSSKDVAQSTKTLSEGIEGLPTTLDTVVATTQKLTSMTGDLKTSTKLTIALNNAFLASGASTEDASRGLQQYTQMLSAGKVDMQSWKTFILHCKTVRFRSMISVSV